MIEDGGCVESLHTTAGLRLKAKMLWHLLYRFFLLLRSAYQAGRFFVSFSAKQNCASRRNRACTNDLLDVQFYLAVTLTDEMRNILEVALNETSK